MAETRSSDLRKHTPTMSHNNSRGVIPADNLTRRTVHPPENQQTTGLHTVVGSPTHIAVPGGHDVTSVTIVPSAKNTLAEKCLMLSLPRPVYVTVRVGGVDHAPIFSSHCQCNGMTTAGTARGRVAAEQAAAETMLHALAPLFKDTVENRRVADILEQIKEHQNIIRRLRSELNGLFGEETNSDDVVATATSPAPNAVLAVPYVSPIFDRAIPAILSSTVYDLDVTTFGLNSASYDTCDWQVSVAYNTIVNTSMFAMVRVVFDAPGGLKTFPPPSDAMPTGISGVLSSGETFFQTAVPMSGHLSTDPETPTGLSGHAVTVSGTTRGRWNIPALSVIRAQLSQYGSVGGATGEVCLSFRLSASDSWLPMATTPANLTPTTCAVQGFTKQTAPFWVSQAAPVGPVVSLTPGPLESEAAAHNSLMHALVGNTEGSIGLKRLLELLCKAQLDGERLPLSVISNLYLNEKDRKFILKVRKSVDLSDKENHAIGRAVARSRAKDDQRREGDVRTPEYKATLEPAQGTPTSEKQLQQPGKTIAQRPPLSVKSGRVKEVPPPASKSARVKGKAEEDVAIGVQEAEVCALREEAVSAGVKRALVYSLVTQDIIPDSVLNKVEVKSVVERHAGTWLMSHGMTLLAAEDLFGLDAGELNTLEDFSLLHYLAGMEPNPNRPITGLREARGADWAAEDDPEVRAEENGANGEWTGTDGVRACEAAGHNRAMHAQNGNTDQGAEMGAVSNQGTGAPSSASTAGLPDAKADMKWELSANMVNLVGQIVRDGFDVNKLAPQVQNPTAAVQVWAQSQKIRSSTQNGIGYKSMTSFFDSWSALVTVRGDSGAGIRSAEIYRNYNASGAASNELKLSDNGASILAANTDGNVVGMSQVLRINVGVGTGVSWSQLIWNLQQCVLGAQTGSTASVMAKLMMMCNSEIPLLGVEAAAFVGGNVTVLNAPLTRAGPVEWWPLSPAHVAVQPAINARICTLNDLTNYLYAGSNPFAPGYTSETWGNTCALVPITSDIMNKPWAMAALTLAHMEYPYKRINYAATAATEAQAAGGATQVRAMSANSRIDGPTARVLYVLMNVHNQPTNITITVGNVDVVYNTNSSAIGGIDVNVVGGLDAFVTTQSNLLGGCGSALTWCRSYLNVDEDWSSALVVAADSCSVIAPVLGTTAGGLPSAAFRPVYYSGAVGWNTTDMTLLTDATAQNAVDTAIAASTGPLNLITVSLADVRARISPLCQIGQLNPIIEVALVGRLLEPVTPVRGERAPITPSSIALYLRKIARSTALLLDSIMRSTPFPMNEMFITDAGATPGAGASSQVHDMWKAAFDLLNLALDTIGAKTVRFYGGNMAGYFPPYWQSYAPGVGGVVLGWSRLPWWQMCTEFGLGKGPDRPSLSPLSPSWSVGQGYPGGDAWFSIFTEQRPFWEDETANDWAWGAASCLFPVVRFPMETLVTNETGTKTRELCWAAVYPTIGRAVAFSLQNFGAISPLRLNSVDVPMISGIPLSSAFSACDFYPGVYGQMWGQYDRNTVTVEDVHVMRDLFKGAEQTMASDRAMHGVNKFMARFKKGAK